MDFAERRKSKAFTCSAHNWICASASCVLQELKVVSVVEKLRVTLEGDGSLFFPPTAVWSQTQRPHHIRNLSHLPLRLVGKVVFSILVYRLVLSPDSYQRGSSHFVLIIVIVLHDRFQWNIPEPDQGFISVEPEAGILHPNESSVRRYNISYGLLQIYNPKTNQKVLLFFLNFFFNLLWTSQAQIWSFSPCEEKTYTVRPTLTFWPVQTPGSNESQLRLKVVGIGFKGFIEVGCLVI